LINDREDVKIQRLIILYFIIEDNQKKEKIQKGHGRNRLKILLQK